MTPEQKLDRLASAFACANHRLAIEAVKTIVKAQAPSRRTILARALIEELALEHLIEMNGQASLAAQNLAADILAVAEPVSELRSSLAGIAHDEPEEPEARASLRD